MPSGRAIRATGGASGLSASAPRSVDDHGSGSRRAGIAARRAIGADHDAFEVELLSQPALHGRAADLEDRLGDVDAARARIDAVEDRPAAPHAVLVGQDLEALVAPSSRESKMKRCAFTIAAGPTYDGWAQNDGHELVHAAHRMHLVVSS